MFTCYVIDDDVTISTFEGYLSLIEFIAVVGVSDNLIESFDTVLALKPDLIFIDVDLAKLNLAKIAIFSTFSSIIVTGTCKNRAFEALDLNAVDFLLKPIEYGSFLRVIVKTNRLLLRSLLKSYTDVHEFDDHLFIRKESNGKQIVKVYYKDILFIEASQNYVTIHLEDCNHLTYLTMKEISDSLPSENFIRIHKSYIINLNKVASIHGNEVSLHNNEKIRIGISYRNSFLSKINRKMVKSTRGMLTDF